MLSRFLPRIFASHPITFGMPKLTSTGTMSASRSDNLELTFIEEPLGLSAEQGFGYAQLQFGQRVGPNDNFEILRKLGWGSYVSGPENAPY
jgi:hypothetical protein